MKFYLEKIHQIYSHIQVGAAKYGMQTMNQSLVDLVRSRQVMMEDALAKTEDPEEFCKMLGRSKMATG